MNDLTSRLLIEEERLKSSKETNFIDHALAVKKVKCFKCQKYGRKKSDCTMNFGDKKFCSYCKKSRHVYNDCYFRNGKFKKNGSHKTEQSEACHSKALIGENNKNLRKGTWICLIMKIPNKVNGY